MSSSFLNNIKVPKIITKYTFYLLIIITITVGIRLYYFSLDVPLISIDTTRAMANGCFENGNSNCFAAPLIDARRMENFNAIYNEDLKEVKSISADILEDGTLERRLDEIL